jgi:broad specificity phosphatase PhoE
MKWVEVRRHSLRDNSGNLSPAGRELIARTTPTLGGPFHAFFASSKPRAIQTIEAMGGRNVQVDDRFGLEYVAKVAAYEPLVQQLILAKKIGLLDAYMEVPEILAVMHDVANDFITAVLAIAEQLPEDGRALVGSHGGTIEPAVMLAMGEFSLKAVGRPFAECEGVRFVIDRDTIIGVEILRLAEASRL